MQYPVLNQEGDKVGELEIPEDLLLREVSSHLWWQVSVGELANRRSGTASTKTRAEVRGGGRKPWRQKGLGRARHGSIRSPIWVGGGVVAGPRPRSYRTKMPRSQKRIAFCSMLLKRFKDGDAVILDSLALPEAKSRAMIDLLEDLEQFDRVLIILGEVDEAITRASRNLPEVRVRLIAETHFNDLLWADSLLLTKSTTEKMIKECEKWLGNNTKS